MTTNKRDRVFQAFQGECEAKLKDLETRLTEKTQAHGYALSALTRTEVQNYELARRVRALEDVVRARGESLRRALIIALGTITYELDHEPFCYVDAKEENRKAALEQAHQMGARGEPLWNSPGAPANDMASWAKETYSSKKG